MSNTDINYTPDTER